MKPEVKIVLTHQDAKLPSYAKLGDAGADVVAVESATIYPGTTAMIDIGIRMEIPSGWEMQVRSRSGLAAKRSLFVLNSPGTIDEGYRGAVKVLLHNAGKCVQRIEAGERIAQLVIKRAPQAFFVEVDELSETERGSGGFGSTG